MTVRSRAGRHGRLQVALQLDPGQQAGRLVQPRPSFGLRRVEPRELGRHVRSFRLLLRVMTFVTADGA